MSIFKVLLDLGLSKKEANVHLAILELGESGLSDIARAAKIPRTSCYGIIEDLIGKNYVTFYVKRKKKYYLAEEPEKILKSLKDKYSLVEAALPQLKAISSKNGVKPKIRFYEGEQGVKQILNEIIGESKNFLAITSVDDAYKIIESFEDFIQRRIERSLRVKLLTNYSPLSLKLKEKDTEELRETRFVPEKFHFKSANFIFGNKVAIISLKKNLLGIIIEDEDISETFRMYFEAIWSCR